MRALNNIRVAVKLPVIMVTLSLSALVVTTVISYLHARSTLAAEAELRLMAVAEARAQAVVALFDGLSHDLDQLAVNPTTLEALDFLHEGWTSLGADDPETRLRDSYQAGTDAAAALVQAGDGTAYSRIHARYHPYFQALVGEGGLSDLYLVDPDGRVVYSVRKGADFARVVERSAPLGQVAAAAHEVTGPVFSDFAQDASRPDAPPTAYLARRVVDARGRVAGTVVVQVDRTVLEAVLAPSGGEDGVAAYLLGAAGVPRSLGAETRAETLQELGPLLSGRTSGMVTAADATGAALFVAHVPIEVFGAPWSVMVERSRARQLAAANDLLVNVVTNIVFLLALICGLGIWLARSVSVPLDRVGAALRGVAQGDLATPVPDTARGDEIGAIARSLEDLQGTLRTAAGTEAENRFRSAALDASSAALMIVDADETITYVNPAARRLMEMHADTFRTTLPDFDPTTIIGKTMAVFHPPGTGARRRIGAGASFPFTADIRVGEARFSLVINAVTAADGTRAGLVAEWKDVTAERMQNAVIASIDRHQCTAEISVDGRVLAANANLCAALGEEPGTLVGAALADLVTEAPGGRAPADLVRGVLDGTPCAGRVRLAGPSGGLCLLDGALSAVLDRNGRPLKLFLMGSDVSAAQAALDAADTDRQAMIADQEAVVSALTVGLRRLSEGDLVSRIDAPFPDDHEGLRRDFNNAVEQLNAAMIGVIENANAIRGEAAEISTAADDLSQRTEKQAGTLEETAAALDELTASVRSAAEGAARANEVVAEARGNAVNSGSVVREAVAAMGQIEESSRQISKIIDVIDDIAFQTNLLALNAGVEAARAGEAGRGFAVVASEVRALAQRSSEAAKEIGALISAGDTHVQRGVGLVDEAGRALDQIVESVTGIADHVSAIAASAQQQSAGLAEINSAVNQLDQVTQSNAAMFEETTAASHALTREAQNLTDMIARFRTGGADSQAGNSGDTQPAERAPSAGAPTARAMGAGTMLRAVSTAGNQWDEF